MICEMAGSYDLLVPLMMSQAIAFVALRRVALYPAQLPAQHTSPVHAATWARHALVQVVAGDLVSRTRAMARLRPDDSADAVLRVMADHADQAVFPVVDGSGMLVGLVTGTREIAAADDVRWAVAADLMLAPVSVPLSAPLADVARVLLQRDLRAVPVLDPDGTIAGLIDEHDVSRAYVGVSDGGVAPHIV
jgi:CIC family chloride channel protein